MNFKELPIKEKYDRLLDSTAMSTVLSYKLAKDLGVVNKLNDLYVKTMKKMLPSYLGISLKILKKIAPNKTFKKIVENFVNNYLQTYHPLSKIEVTWPTNNKAVIKINCEYIKKMNKIIKKSGLDINPKIWCESESYIYQELLRDFGLNINHKPEAQGCIATVKLK